MSRNQENLNNSVAAAERIYYHYTTAALEDELTCLLSSKNQYEILLGEDGTGHIHVFHPYLNQAEGLLYKINIYRPLPEFVIWVNDIPLGLALALERLGNVAMKRIITNAVRRLYESVNPEYYHKNGIHGKVKWRFGQQ